MTSSTGSIPFLDLSISSNFFSIIVMKSFLEIMPSLFAIFMISARVAIASPSAAKTGDDSAAMPRSALNVMARVTCFRFIVSLLPWLGLLSIPGMSRAPELPSGWTPKKPVSTRQDMVAAANPLAVEAGHQILKQGGSAVDAAVAVQMVLNLVEPQSSGIGGGAFMLFHNGRNGLLTAYDGRETAPSAAKPDRFLDKEGKPLKFYDAVVGGKSVGVPGTLRLLELAHRQYGKLQWAELFEPAIRLAEQGFAVSPRLNINIAGEKYLTQERAKAYFYNPDASPLAVGSTLKNPAFAATLKRIAAEGADAFYQGEIARDIVDTARTHPTNPGDLTEADLSGYKVKVREPICGHYRVYNVCGMPPPSSGGITVVQILGILERFDMKAIGAGSLFSVHLITEAGRLAYADRNQYLADPDFVKAPEGMTDPAYLHERAALIKLDVSMGRAKAGTPA